MAEVTPEKSGWVLLSAVFGRGTYWLGRNTSTGGFMSLWNNGCNVTMSPGMPNTKRRRGSDERWSLSISPQGNRMQGMHITWTISRSQAHTTRVMWRNKVPPSPDGMVTALSSVARNSQPSISQGRRVMRYVVGISGELESVITDHQKSQGSRMLVQASSSNVMLAGSLGDFRQSGTTTGVWSSYDMYYLLKTSNDKRPVPNGSYMESTTKKSNVAKPGTDPPLSLCCALLTRADPETLKILGNKDYKKGRFSEALALYEAAIYIALNKNSGRSNKSAAFTALQRVIEAPLECKEAIRIEPNYY